MHALQGVAQLSNMPSRTSTNMRFACREHDSAAFSKQQYGSHPAVYSCGPVPYQPMASYLTRCTPLVHVSFTRSNLLLAGGPRLPLDKL